MKSSYTCISLLVIFTALILINVCESRRGGHGRPCRRPGGCGPLPCREDVDCTRLGRLGHVAALCNTATGYCDRNCTVPEDCSNSNSAHHINPLYRCDRDPEDDSRSFCARTCSSDNQCGRRGTCDGEICSKPNRTCADSTDDCRSGFGCNLGYCDKTCSDSHQCGMMGDCENGFCVSKACEDADEDNQAEECCFNPPPRPYEKPSQQRQICTTCEGGRCTMKRIESTINN